MHQIKHLLEERRHDRLREKAERMFAERSFMEAYESLFTTTMLGRYVLPVLSIVTGGFFLYQLVGLNIYIGLPLAALLMVGYEVAKMRLLQAGFQAHYGQSPTAYALLAVSAALCAGSVIMSVRGAGEIYKAHDLRAEAVRMEYTAKIDSVGAKIAALEALKPKRWGGLLSKSENKMILNYQDEVKRLEAEMHSEREAVLEGGAFNYKAITIIAAVIEALILLSAWFYVYYHFICYHEVALERKTPSSPTLLPTSLRDKEEAIRLAVQKGNVRAPDLMKNFRLNVQQSHAYIKKYAIA